MASENESTSGGGGEVVITLSPAQQSVVDAIRERRNIFMTGPAGAGKSLVIGKIREQARCAGVKVALTATTGVAADLLGGVTIHSQLGLGLAKEEIPVLVAKASRSGKIKSKWAGVGLLIIDEISMMDPEFLNKLDAVLKGLNRSSDPFGGICVLFSGDFYQLPPVLPRGRPEGSPNFAFQSEAWINGNIETIELQAIYRQQGDPTLAEILRRARTADHTIEDIDILYSRVGAQLNPPEGIEPTRLYSLKRRVDAVNSSRLSQLPDEAEAKVMTGGSYWQLDTSLSASKRQRTTGRQLTKGEKEKALREAEAKILQNVPTPTSLELKVGAQVMLLANLDQENGLVNGSRGVVTGFENETPVVKFSNCEIPVHRHGWEYVIDGAGIVTYRQTPLRLAWAVTIHKAQGMSIDWLEMTVDQSVFECGQAYVGLSRVRSLEGLTLSAFDPRVVRAHPDVKAFYTSIGV